ncbi:MAG: hypothetical protein JW869_04820 [Candidatus Omnitrophica bacterium]|nr:hypothetical protein [Candidatus Omnitrophota bacterium]
MFRISVLDVAKTGAVFDDLASCVVLPGEDGEISLLDFHQTIVACLKEGTIRIDNKKPIPIKKGIARAEKNKISVIIER